MKLQKSHKAFSGEVRFYQHDSLITKSKMNFSAFIPSGKIKGALLWLSGLTCTEENFISKAGALPFLNQKGLCLICPDTSPWGLNLPNEELDWDFGSGASFYLNARMEGYREHYLMQDYLMNELLELINSAFKLNENISISGHSMGGHGALCLGLKFPQKFRSVSAFSPIVNPINCPWGRKAFLGYLGEDETLWQEYDSCELLKQGYQHPNPILVSQGKSDPFIEEQLKPEALEKALLESNQVLTLEYEEGFDHSYFFIASFIKRHIDFHSSFLLSP